MIGHIHYSSSKGAACYNSDEQLSLVTIDCITAYQNTYIQVLSQISSNRNMHPKNGVGLSLCLAVNYFGTESD